MSRPIKFRAWHSKGRTMLEEVLIGGGTYGDSPSNLNAELEGLWSEGVELMQFTGLLDKNGKEIYEGDIVRLVTPVRTLDGEAPIYFEGGAFQFRGEALSYLGSPDFFEVVGNIYESK